MSVSHLTRRQPVAARGSRFAVGVERVREPLEAAGKPSRIVPPPDTPRGSHVNHRPSDREEQARNGRAGYLDWFGKYGVS